MHIYFSLLITVLSESAVFTVHVILYSFQVPKKTNIFNREHTLIIKKKVALNIILKKYLHAYIHN